MFICMYDKYFKRKSKLRLLVENTVSGKKHFFFREKKCANVVEVGEKGKRICRKSCMCYLIKKIQCSIHIDR